jgi:dephospho-CoA kinase
MLKVGITGGIGTGKSTVCKIFAAIGIPVLDSDLLAKQIVHHNPQVRRQIASLFGEDIYANNSLDKTLLAKRAFANKENTELLNSIVHPIVAIESEKWFEAQRNIAFAIKEAALLIESGTYESLDFIVGVSASESTRIERLLKRPGIAGEQDIQQRIARQMPEAEKQKHYTFTIQNNDNDALLPQVWAVYEQLCTLSNGKAKH